MNWKVKAKNLDYTINKTVETTQLNNAINYIEQHLQDKIDYEELAKYSLFSLHHFLRLFSFAVGVSVSEYIRRRRLTLAAFELQNSKVKVLDIALKYGYDSPTSFCRAFKNIHGINPNAARRKGVSLKAYPRITFKLSIKGDIEMNYRLEQREAFEVFGVETIIKNQKAMQEIPLFWTKCRTNGSIAQIKQAAGVTVNTPIHAALYDCTEEQYKYMLCMPLSDGNCSDKFTRLLVPAGEWAVFSTPEQTYEEISVTAASLWKEIFTEWFAVSGYELAQGPEMEMHYHMGGNHYKTEIWIPIDKR